MDTFRGKFLFAYILLHSVLIFSCYDYIKSIEIPNFIVKKEAIASKFVLGFIQYQYFNAMFAKND